MRSYTDRSSLSVAPMGVLRRSCECGGVRRSAKGDATASTMAIPEAVHETLRSPGRPLDAATRAQAEHRFDDNFAHVRVHTDERAAASADAIGALAYTVGDHLVFARDRFAPST